MGAQCRQLQFGMVARCADRCGDACTDYDTISATDLHKCRWIMQVCFSSSIFHLINKKQNHFFDLPPPTLKKSWGLLFRGLSLAARVAESSLSTTVLRYTGSLPSTWTALLTQGKCHLLR